jgi:hypothetical protein
LKARNLVSSCIVAEEWSLDHEPHLACGLHQLPNDLIEFGEEGADDPCHHNVVQSSPIDGWIDNIGEDVVIEDVAMKREEHEVAPLLVVR